MTEAIRNRIREIIAEQAMLDVAQVTDGSTPEELGIDSLGLVDSIFALEEERHHHPLQRQRTREIRVRYFQHRQDHRRG